MLVTFCVTVVVCFVTPTVQGENSVPGMFKEYVALKADFTALDENLKNMEKRIYEKMKNLDKPLDSNRTII